MMNFIRSKSNYFAIEKYKYIKKPLLGLRDCVKEKNRDELQNYLMHNGIQTRKFFWPLHLQNALPSEFKTNETLSISENLGSNGLYLPIGDHINKKDQEFIANKIKVFLLNN